MCGTGQVPELQRQPAPVQFAGTEERLFAVGINRAEEDVTLRARTHCKRASSREDLCMENDKLP